MNEQKQNLLLKHFYQKKYEGLSAFLFILGAFLTVLNWIFLRTIPYQLFKGDMWLDDGATMVGFFAAIWIVTLLGLFFYNAVQAPCLFMVLRQYKIESESTWFSSLVDLASYEKARFTELQNAFLMLVGSIALPLLSQFLDTLHHGWQLFIMYFALFLLLSSFGLAEEIHRQFLSLHKRKEMKKQKRKEKTEEKKDEKQIELKEVLLTFEAKLDPSSIFASELVGVVNEMKTVLLSDDPIDIETEHMMTRMIKEDIPSLIRTHEQLEEEGQQEMIPHFKQSLTKMKESVAVINEQRKEQRKKDAQKTIKLMDSRYENRAK